MRKLLALLLLALPVICAGQVLKTSAVPYTKGATPYTPNIATNSEIRIDTSCSCLYWWDRDALTWRRSPYGVDVITGGIPPAYTPTNNMGLFAINASSELYYYNGSTWDQIGGGGAGGIYGGSGTVPDGTTATLTDDFIIQGGNISSITITTGDTIGGQYFSNINGASVVFRDTSGDNTFTAHGNGFSLTTAGGTSDLLLIAGRDARYDADYSIGYSDRSLVDKEYVDGVVTAGISIPDGQIAFGAPTDDAITSDVGFLFDGDGVEITQTNPYVGLYGSSSVQFFAVDQSASGATKGGVLLLSSEDGAAMASGDRLGVIYFNGQTGVGGTGTGATIEAYTAGTWGGGDAPGELRIYTTPDGSATPAERLKVTMSGDVGIKKNSDGATQDFTTVTAYGAETNLGVAIRPKGSGAFSLDMPDGASTGGNSRGTNAVDLQITRSAAHKVASGNYSFLGGGRNNTASGDGSFCVGGSAGFNVGSVASGTNSGTFGNADTASAVSAFVMGQTSTASGDYSQAFGLQALANHRGQAAFGSADAGAVGYAQSSTMRVYTAKTGTGAIELFLDGTSGSKRMTLVDNQFWNVTIQVLATTQTVGDGAGTAGHTYAATYSAVIKRIGGTTALVGTVQTISAAQSDASMSDAVFTIDADDTNDALRVQFTPPSTAGSSSVYKAFATMHLAELRY